MNHQPAKHPLKFLFFLITFGLPICLFFSTSAYANQIQAIKGSKVLIVSDTDTYDVGERVFATDSNGKKKAIIQIEKVKDNKAFGILKKGKAQKGMGILKTGSSAGAKSQKTARSRGRTTETDSDSSSDKPLSLGFLLGIGLDSMSVKLLDDAGNTVETLAQSGTGFSAKALLDYNLGFITVRAMGGLEKFNVSGTASSAVCDGTTGCKTDIMYMSLDVLGLISLMNTSSMKLWLGGGAGLWLPASKSSNTLEANSISSTSPFYGGVGADIKLDKDSYIPLQVLYVMLPRSSDVSAHAIAIQGGMAWRF